MVINIFASENNEETIRVRIEHIPSTSNGGDISRRVSVSLKVGREIREDLGLVVTRLLHNRNR